MTTHLMHLIYLSELVDRKESVLADILESAVRHNQRNEVSGMLLYADGNFLQVIEGEPQAVQETFERIRKDPRHRNVTVLLEEPLSEQHFSQWSMGYKQLRAEDVLAFPHHAPFFKYGFNAKTFEPTPGDALELLMLFSKGAL
jgi:hypothetical protein